MRQPRALIAIGASTGGPRAFQHILTQFSADFSAAILIVQHMPRAFTGPFADRLDDVCALNVKEAEHRDHVKGGNVYVAPGDCHMTVRQQGTRLYIELDDSEAVSGHRPSVDRLFYSLKDITHIPLMFLLLTGMGKDGARGIEVAKRANPAITTIAQDESSCTIFGMPRAAIQTGCVDRVLPLKNIAAEIKKRIGEIR